MIAPALTSEEGETVRRPFLNAKTFLGAVKRGVRPGVTAAMAVEEGALYAERKYHWTGLAAAGAIVGEVLWTLQLEKERKEREEGPQR
jgi:hypothetical protein